MSLLSPERMAEAVAMAEGDSPDVADDNVQSEDAVEVVEDSAETVSEAEDLSDEVEAASDDVPDIEEEVAEDDVGAESALSDEDQAWLDKYMADGSESSEESGFEERSEFEVLRDRIAHLERDRAVALAEKSLVSEIKQASKRFPTVSTEDMIAAVQSNPQIQVDAWAARESKRIVSVESRIEARLRKELKLEKSGRAGEFSPPRGNRAKTSNTVSKRKLGSVADATRALRSDMRSGKFG
jgi:predicted metal-dependent hydrolase